MHVFRSLTTALVSVSLVACSGPKEGSPTPSMPPAKTMPKPSSETKPEAGTEPLPVGMPLPSADGSPPTQPQFAPLPGKVVSATAASRGVDAFSSITSDHAKAISAAGFGFAVRYVRHADSRAKHITREEAEGILAAGLSLMLVQEGRGWKETRPTAALGKRDGEAGVAHALELGYPAGANLWLDIEGITNPEVTASDVIAYAEAWHAAVERSFVPGYYVGPVGKLDAAQLGALPFEHFWKSGTKVPVPAGRGYQIVQHPPRTVGGVKVDVNITQTDEKGQVVRWVGP